tara:strand:- start:1736 stop:3058 length:1323 start_codon:yes stop_codon:yes gene_type:complete
VIDTLTKLVDAMGDGASFRFYAKKLAPNDNSKNQVYLGGGFTALNIIPHSSVYTDDTARAGSIRDRAKASVKFSWVDEAGKHLAPNTQLILYSKYPEVRMSGFLRGCQHSPSEVMKSRAEGRVMFLGVFPDRHVIGFAVFADHPIARQLSTLTDAEETGVFLELSSVVTGEADTKNRLLQALRIIHQKNWIPSQKITDGLPTPYAAQNGGGYTLEAELGIAPNGNAEPDYLGWEVKQYGVKDFEKNRAKGPITLMTPEPTGGEYRDDGVAEFIRRYGYPDTRGVEDRINFGGVYKNGEGFHNRTGLALRIKGFDAGSGKIIDMNGGIYLLSKDDDVAAVWDFSEILDHWNRKHARAVYVPSLSRKSPLEYRYGHEVTLCEETDFLFFLSALASGKLYYDPGIKMENASGDHPKIKRRSQFRMKQVEINSLYAKTQIHSLN